MTSKLAFSLSTRVFIDTCWIMHPQGPEILVDHILPALPDPSTQLVLAYPVSEELKKHMASDNPDRATAARKATLTLATLQRKQLIRVMGGSNDTFPDNLFQQLFAQWRLTYNLVLLTNDRALAADIIALRSSASVQNIRRIHVYFIKKGELMSWETQRKHANENMQPQDTRYHGAEDTASDSAERTTRGIQPFETAKEVTSVPDTPIRIQHVPKAGDVITLAASGTRYTLNEQLGAGGEGTAWKLPDGQVAKIFHADKMNRRRLAKLQLMTSNPVRHPSICWPHDLVKNAGGEVVGYVMPQAQGRELDRSVFRAPLMARVFPHWNRSHLVQVCIHLLQAVRYLHAHNVLIGDINGRNIMVDENTNVWLVDCDSYQVAGFPSPVGVQSFLAPELRGISLGTRLRTVESELYSLSVLLFMLFLPGKGPYAYQGGGDLASNLQAQHFPYPFGDTPSSGVPVGPWYNAWSQLIFRAKELFFHTFSDGRRFPIQDWLDMARRFENALERGFVSNEIFPRYRKELSREEALARGGRWIACHGCGREFGAMKSFHTLCVRCVPARK
jgi:rRNA-processing protein FCF1